MHLEYFVRASARLFSCYGVRTFAALLRFYQLLVFTGSLNELMLLEYYYDVMFKFFRCAFRFDLL